MKYIYFHNAIFSKGRHLTIRKGSEWYQSITKGEILTLVDMETGGHSKTGKVLRVEVMKFKDVPEDILRTSLNPDCKSKDGLLNNMKSIYLDFKPEEDEVSLIFFEVE
jgi:hypothetical protein